MDSFDYKIKVDDLIIAKFINECDRDYSMDTLAEIFADAEFTAVDDEDE